MPKQAECTCQIVGMIRVTHHACPFHGDNAQADEVDNSRERVIMVLWVDDGSVIEVARVRPGERPSETYRRCVENEARETNESIDEMRDSTDYEVFNLTA